MHSLKRPLAATGAAALLALSLTACGGGYPSDASDKDFCGGITDIVAASSVEGDEPTEEEWEKIQESYADLGDIGTPEGIGDEERNGFEVAVDAITDLDFDDAKKAFGDEDGEDTIPGVSKDDEKDVETFFDYAQETCADAISGE